MQKLRKILSKLIWVERYVCCAILIVIMAICFGSVLMRYVLNKPWAWSEEVIIVFLVWFGFLCMSIETYRDSNIAITGFYNKLPKKAQRFLDLLRHVLLTVFYYLMTTESWRLFWVNSRKRLPASQWNQGLQYFPMVFGGAIMLAFSLINIIGVLINEKRGTLVEGEEGTSDE